MTREYESVNEMLSAALAKPPLPESVKYILLAQTAKGIAMADAQVVVEALLSDPEQEMAKGVMGYLFDATKDVL